MIRLSEVFRGDFSSLMGVSLGFYDTTYSTGRDSLVKKATHHAGIVTYEQNQSVDGRQEEEVAYEVYQTASFKATAGRKRGQTVHFMEALNSVGPKDRFGRVGFFAESGNRREVVAVMNAFAQALVAKGCEWQELE